MTDEPKAELEPQFSSADATATPWAEARGQLERAKAYWISTVRPDGRPHVTTIAAIWLDDAVHFTTGPSERKAKNLEHNPRCVITTGTDAFDGIDVVVEGEAVRVTDEARLRRMADAYRPKYDDLFGFEARDGALWGQGSEDPALAFEVRASKAFAFGKGRTFSQTRYRFPAP